MEGLVLERLRHLNKRQSSHLDNYYGVMLDKGIHVAFCTMLQYSYETETTDDAAAVSAFGDCICGGVLCDGV